MPNKKTPVFTEQHLPEALRRDHATGAGVWAKIHVLKGRLRYRVPALRFDTTLTPENPGVVIPEVPHSVEPIGSVEFFWNFYQSLGR